MTQEIVDQVREALKDAVDMLEQNAETIDSEWDRCRSREQLEEQHEFPPAVYTCRKALEALDRKREAK